MRRLAALWLWMLLVPIAAQEPVFRIKVTISGRQDSASYTSRLEIGYAPCAIWTGGSGGWQGSPAEFLQKAGGLAAIRPGMSLPFYGITREGHASGSDGSESSSATVVTIGPGRAHWTERDKYGQSEKVTDPDDRPDQTLRHVTSLVGGVSRIVAPAMGDMNPVDQVNWNAQRALESLVFLLRKYGVDGGSFWRWVNFQNSEDSDSTLPDAVKRRGIPFVYNAVQNDIVDMGGFHVPVVPNGSFEGAVDNGIPANWTASGNGTVSQYLLTQDTGQPEVPSRGTHAMRIITGAGSNDNITATSPRIPVIAATTYTTTANMHFAWTGDPNPGGPPASRPQVFINIRNYSG